MTLFNDAARELKVGNTIKATNTSVNEYSIWERDNPRVEDTVSILLICRVPLKTGLGTVQNFMILPK